MRALPFLTRTFAVITLLCAPVQSAASAENKDTQPAELPPTDVSPDKRLETLSTELKASRKTIPLEWMVKFPKPELVKKQTKETLRELYDKLLLFHDEVLEPTATNDKLFDKWAYNFEGVYTHRIMLEWQSFDIAWAEFLKLEKAISKTRMQRDHQTHTRFTASLADTNLRLWIGTHPEVLLPWIERFGANSLADEAGELPSWWLRSRCDYGLSLEAEGDVNKPHPKSSEWLQEYLETEQEPLDVRAGFLARQITYLHTGGRAQEALRLLNWWKTLHPEHFAKDPSLLHKSFFVFQIGLGDRAAARNVFRDLDELVEQGSLSRQNDLYRVVTQNYYQNLMRSDLSHQKHISRLSKDLNRQSK